MKRYLLSEEARRRFDGRFGTRVAKDSGRVLAVVETRSTAADELARRALEFRQRPGDLWLIQDRNALDRFSPEVIFQTASPAEKSDHPAIVLWVVFRDTGASAPAGEPVTRQVCPGRVSGFTLAQSPCTNMRDDDAGREVSEWEAAA